MKKIIGRIQILSLFDYAIIAGAILFLLFLFIVLFRKTTSITFTMKVTNPNILYSNDNPPYWYAYSLQKGDAERDSFGKIRAEIQNVQIYPINPNRKVVFLKVSVLAVFNKSKKQYSYKGKPIIVGSNIRLELQNNLIDGVITETGLNSLPYEEKELLISAKVVNLEPVYQETEGVGSYIADAIHVGDSIKDASGNTILKIIDKQTQPADRYVMTSDGRVFVTPDPKKKDVYLTLMAKVKEIQGEEYFLDSIRVRVGEELPIDLPNITIYPVITDIKR